MFDKPFTPITIRDMTLRNRIIMPAMGTRFTEDRFVNEKHIAYHVARTRGGSALNIVDVPSRPRPQCAQDVPLHRRGQAHPQAEGADRRHPCRGR